MTQMAMRHEPVRVGTRISPFSLYLAYAGTYARASKSTKAFIAYRRVPFAGRRTYVAETMLGRENGESWQSAGGYHERTGRDPLAFG